MTQPRSVVLLGSPRVVAVKTWGALYCDWHLVTTVTRRSCGCPSQRKLSCSLTDFVAETGRENPRGRAAPLLVQVWSQNNAFWFPPNLKKILKFPAPSSSLFF